MFPLVSRDCSSAQPINEIDFERKVENVLFHPYFVDIWNKLLAKRG